MKNRSLTTMLILAICAMLMMTTATAMAEPSRGNLVHFVPTVITVTRDSVDVDGYFVNLNQDCDVLNFKEFEMGVYKDGELLISGDFGTINQFTVKSMRTKYQSFTFNQDHDLNPGVYHCNDHYYTAFSCKFSTQSSM